MYTLYVESTVTFCIPYFLHPCRVTVSLITFNFTSCCVSELYHIVNITEGVVSVGVLCNWYVKVTIKINC